MKRGCDFEREEMDYGMVKREGRNDVIIIISKYKRTKQHNNKNIK